MAAKLVTNGTGIKYVKSPSSDLIWRGTKDFSYLIGTIWWPTTVTAKPKTSQQNQILHSKGKIALVLLWVFAFAVGELVLL